MIKTVGSNVSPAEVEWKCRKSSIHSAYVVGLPDRARSEGGGSGGAEGRRATHLTRSRKHWRNGCRPSRYHAYISITREEVPMLPSNKVARRLLGS